MLFQDLSDVLPDPKIGMVQLIESFDKLIQSVTVSQSRIRFLLGSLRILPDVLGLKFLIL
jgi:hypothetical protein